MLRAFYDASVAMCFRFLFSHQRSGRFRRGPIHRATPYSESIHQFQGSVGAVLALDFHPKTLRRIAKSLCRCAKMDASGEREPVSICTKRSAHRGYRGAHRIIGNQPSFLRRCGPSASSAIPTWPQSSAPSCETLCADRRALSIVYVCGFAQKLEFSNDA